MIDKQKRWEILKLAAYRGITQKEAADRLELSLSHTKRLIKKVKLSRTADCLSFQRSHPASNKIPDSVREKVISLKLNNQASTSRHLQELLNRETGIKIHPNTIRNILLERNIITNCKIKPEYYPLKAKAFGMVALMDTNQFVLKCDHFNQTLSLIMIIDEYSSLILAARFFEEDSTYNNMLIIREALEKFGQFTNLYVMNNSKFKLTRYSGSRFFNYSEVTLSGEVVTELHRSLMDMGIILSVSSLINPLPTLKLIKQLFNRIKRETRNVKGLNNMDCLNDYFAEWKDDYNHKLLDTLKITARNLSPSAFRQTGETNLEDIFCIKKTRTIDENNSFSYNGEIYTLPVNFMLFGSRVNLNIHPARKIRVFNNAEFICEIPLSKAAVADIVNTPETGT